MSSVVPGEIAFPLDATGQRPSTATGAGIVAAALQVAQPDHAAAALREHHWRRAYPLHFRRLVEVGLADAAVAQASAAAGLREAYAAMRWATRDGDVPLDALHAAPVQANADWDTFTLRGTVGGPPARWSVPYRGAVLEGGALQAQVERWVAVGIIEPSAGEALRRCAENPDWFDLSDRTLVLLGAGSEAGPLAWLARWRANVVAVDIARPAVWTRIAGLVREGNGVLHAPVRAGTEDWTARAGADLLQQAPALRDWIASSFEGPLDIAAHGYVDGERHVRLALAMDLVQGLAAQRAGSTLAWMATPTDVFAVPRATAEESMRRWQERPATSRGMQLPLRLATGERFFQPNVERLHTTAQGASYGIVDSLVVEQGPNYALAKRLQQWRALVARQAGITVSLNIAPSTTTASVVKNPALAAGFAGAAAFGIEVFEPATTNALMAALWVHDLRSAASAAQPARALQHPYELFMDNACHGGLWTNPYLPRSALPFAALLGWLRRRTGT